MTQALTHRTTMAACRAVRWIFGAALPLIAMTLITACDGSDSPTTRTLSSISVTPMTMSVAAGVSDQLAAIAVYSDGSKQDISRSVTWASSSPQVATINPSGFASSLAPGSTTIRATLSGVSGSAILTVTAATLVSIGVTPAQPSVADGSTLQFSATGVYTDNSTHDLTTLVTWISSNSAVMSISNSTTARGLATTLVPGNSSVTASLNGITSPAVTLTVTPATLVSIAVTPAIPSIAAGTTEQFIATGTYTDQSTQNLTSAVTWASSKTSVATVSNSTGTLGLATSLSPGSTSVTATLNGVTSAAVTLAVTPATLVSIAVTPANPSIAAGTTEQFTATGTYTDHSTQNLTTAATWSSSNIAIAAISNASGSNGLATSLQIGEASFTAQVGGISSKPVTLSVTAATLVSIGMTPAMPSIAAGGTQQFIATGVYTDNSTQNLTTTVIWMSSNPAVASISNAAGSKGLATTLTPGATSVTAALNAVSSPAVTLTVTAATLVSIAVTPVSPSIAAGTTEQFTAVGTYSDSSTQNLTTSVTWGSSNPVVASISNASGSNGSATGIETGQVSINAQLGGVSSVPVTLTVSRATLVSIAVTPTSPAILNAGTQQFVATGTYTDNSSQILTASVTWSSSDVDIASISNATNSNGLATGLELGTVSISAVLGAVTSTAVTLTVTPQPERVLYSFAGGVDGENPNSALIQASDGNFYGTTPNGGANNLGTVFKITSAGVETVLHSFAGGSDGRTPYAALIQGSDGNFYGTTVGGGTDNRGTVYKITAAGVETVLYSFAAGSDGANPYAALIQGSDGNFYGTTYFGGTIGAGTVFQITPAGVETVLHSFTGSADGGNCYAALIQGSDGNFYGTTAFGGPHGYGAVFKITSVGVETVLYLFAGGSDGSNPHAALIQGNDGNFYGTTTAGGANGEGTVFKISSAVETLLYSFAGGSDGATPFAPLLQGSDGNFYGTTTDGGANGEGTVFKISSAGVETVLHAFTGGSDGENPYAALIQGSDGNFYGTTNGGGTNGAGTLFTY